MAKVSTSLQSRLGHSPAWLLGWPVIHVPAMLWLGIVIGFHMLVLQYGLFSIPGDFSNAVLGSLLFPTGPDTLNRKACH